MKKLIAFISVLLLALCLFGCATTQQEGKMPASNTSNEDTAGTIKFYSEATKEFTEPVSTTSIELSKEQEKEIKRILKNVKEWTDDHSVNRLAYYFDGEFTLSDSEFVYYFTYEYNVIYYDHYYAEIGAEEMEYIKSIGVTE